MFAQDPTFNPIALYLDIADKLAERDYKDDARHMSWKNNKAMGFHVSCHVLLCALPSLFAF